ncbi:MAG: metallophosphoesterase [Corynebacterium sp.]|nr:metallophosphoesterase [Corynebacterium sp.]
MINFDKEDFWLVSDLHLDHPLVSSKRGFQDTYAHDSAVLGGLYELPESSLLVCLGDISVRKDDYALARLLELKHSKNLTMILTPGNHDACHPKFGLKGALEWMPKYQAVFDVIVLEFVVKYKGREVLFTHMPRLDDPFRKPKLTRWIGRDGFDCIVHGHTHSSQLLDEGHINLSLEATEFAPVHASRLWKLVEEVSPQPQ